VSHPTLVPSRDHATDRSLRLQQVNPENPARDTKSLAQFWVDVRAVQLDGQPARVSGPQGPESLPWMLQPKHFMETLSTITTFAKHPTRQLSPKPTTRLQTPIFSSFLGCRSARHWINLESLQILIARLIHHMLLTNTKIHYRGKCSFSLPLFGV
jgi:hypothetical protein